MVLAGCGAALYFYVDGLSYKVCRVEAGVSVCASDFMKNAEDATFTENSQDFDVTKPGEYAIEIQSGFFTHKATLIVQDTIAPVATSVAVTLFYGETCDATAFVTEIEDATTVSVAFAQEVDFTRGGTQTVLVALTDLGGNVTTLNCTLQIIPVCDSLTMEVGADLPDALAYAYTGESASYGSEIFDISLTEVGEYAISVVVDGESYTVTLIVEDTTSPVVEVCDIDGWVGESFEAKDFVTEISDCSAVSISYETEPDFSLEGAQTVAILCEDAYGNTTTAYATLTLVLDDEPPVIKGVANMLVYIGESVSYRDGVTVSDNSGADITLEIDAENVNLEAQGSYTVVYSATDPAGNTTSTEATVTVLRKEYTEQEVYAKADAVLASILTDGMSDYEKVLAIFNYVKSTITYVNHTQKENMIWAAGSGLIARKGDCYVYASTSEVLLTRAGIKNMMIAKIPAKTLHYWNLVCLNGTWYHFDTTPRTDHPTIFLWTDSELMEYSAAHNNSHNYDHSLYPTVD